MKIRDVEVTKSQLKEILVDYQSRWQGLTLEQYKFLLEMLTKQQLETLVSKIIDESSDINYVIDTIIEEV